MKQTDMQLFEINSEKYGMGKPLNYTMYVFPYVYPLQFIYLQFYSVDYMHVNQYFDT